MFDPRDDTRDRGEGGRERAYDLQANRRERDADEDGQEFHAGVSRVCDEGSGPHYRGTHMASPPAAASAVTTPTARAEAAGAAALHAPK